MESKKRMAAAELTERHNGIGLKISIIEDKMESINKQLEEKGKEIQSIDTDTKDLIERLRRLEHRSRLYNQLHRLLNVKIRLGEQYDEESTAFWNGEYYAFTNDYWEVGEVTREGENGSLWYESLAKTSHLDTDTGEKSPFQTLLQ
jgi:hypothetical protein